eukprot:jgi/Botrbrau1/7623/Bobra.0159s0072.1
MHPKNQLRDRWMKEWTTMLEYQICSQCTLPPLPHLPKACRLWAAWCVLDVHPHWSGRPTPNPIPGVYTSAIGSQPWPLHVPAYPARIPS